ncbi:MAG: ribbon-helix-helix protein, CopG family [Verrucomicrobiota bacterium]|nr:ribbon-helix-helix protein, CopG family [Verrucomicrobiota bacterium]
MGNMVFDIKTTLNISEETMRKLKREAARRGQTMSELVDAALQTIIEPGRPPRALPPLPEFSAGGSHVNVADRNALYSVMEG